MTNKRGLGTTKHAITLDGPIGVGKTTYGRFLAKRFAEKFLEGDDFSDPEKRWYGSSLSTHQWTFKASLAALNRTHIVFIGYPLRCVS